MYFLKFTIFKVLAITFWFFFAWHSQCCHI